MKILTVSEISFKTKGMLSVCDSAVLHTPSGWW